MNLKKEILNEMVETTLGLISHARTTVPKPWTVREQALMAIIATMEAAIRILKDS